MYALALTPPPLLETRALSRARSRALGKDTLCRGPATETLGKGKPSAKRPLALGKADALGKLDPLGHGGHPRQALPRASR
jgi:hypothetical protein